MPEYLIDVNLPYYFSLWNTPEFIHQLNIGDAWTDEMIWQYAKKQDLIIITKDKDFSVKQFIYGAPPKVIHIKFGNVKLKLFFQIITACWRDAEALISNHNLVNIYQNKLEAIQ